MMTNETFENELVHGTSNFYNFMIEEALKQGRIDEDQATYFKNKTISIKKKEKKMKIRTREKTPYELYYERQTPIIMEERGLSRREARRVVRKNWDIIQEEERENHKKKRGRPLGSTGPSEYQLAVGAIADYIRKFNQSVDKECSKSRARELARGYWKAYSGDETNPQEIGNIIIKSLSRFCEFTPPVSK